MKHDSIVVVTGLATIVGTAIAVWALVSASIGSLEHRMDARMNSLDERIFWVATGRNLSEVVKEERLKRSDT